VSKKSVIVVVIVVAVVVVGGALWWFLRDDAPEQVNLSTATEQVEAANGAADPV
jgi:flagellar basal body-associated protein FliL